MIHTLQPLPHWQCTLGEGSFWDVHSQTLYLVDILGKQVHSYHPSTQLALSYDVPEYIGTVVPDENNGLIVALKSGFARLDLQSGAVSAIITAEGHPTEHRFNDGKCDPAGRLWAGTISLKNDQNSALLYCLDTDLSQTIKIKDITNSNGIIWSIDHKTLYHIDTPTRQVSAYDYNKETAEITNKRIIITVTEEQGWPDGMTIDSEGNLWICMWGGSRVTRYDSKSGNYLSHIELPVPNVTSCTFGGENLDVLYVTTAREGLEEDDITKYPLSGHVFEIKNTGYNGIPGYRYSGKFIEQEVF